MKTFAILFLLGVLVSCASNQTVVKQPEEVTYPYTDYPAQR